MTRATDGRPSLARAKRFSEAFRDVEVNALRRSVPEYHVEGVDRAQAFSPRRVGYETPGVVLRTHVPVHPQKGRCGSLEIRLSASNYDRAFNCGAVTTFVSELRQREIFSMIAAEKPADE